MGSDPPRSPDDIASRIEAARRRAARAGRKGNEGPAEPSMIGTALRMGVEFVVSVGVGGVVGYFLDAWLGTKPILMIAFLFLGLAAGVLNVYRVSKGLDTGVGIGRSLDRGKDRDGDKPTGGQSG